MKSIMQILVFFWTVIISGYAIAEYFDGHEKHAYHSHNSDRLQIFDVSISGGITTYTPDYDEIPSNVVVDQIYLNIEFKGGVSASIDLIVNVTCGPRIYGKEKFRYRENGNALAMSYSFVDVEEEEVFPDANCWQFSVLGEDIVEKVQIYVTYHVPFEENMPALYAPDPYISFGNDGSIDIDSNGENTLHEISPADLTSERSSDSISKGKRVSQGSKKLIVLIHGWNPSDKANNYTPNDNVVPNLLDETNFESSWAQLYTNLSEHPAIQSDSWVVARYDWAKDAATGPGSVLEPYDSPGRANAARDAAFVHGKKLGLIISSLNPDNAITISSPLEIQFIAHSAGNWVARRAIDLLETKYGSSVNIQLTSLDPFVNGDDLLTLADDINLQPDFELLSTWGNILENYYVVDFKTDTPTTQNNYWTSGNFLAWPTQIDIESSPESYLYLSEMKDHAGPISWYSRTTNKIYQPIHAAIDYELGFARSIAYRWDNSSPKLKSKSYTTSPSTDIYIFFDHAMDSTSFVGTDGTCNENVSVQGLGNYTSDCIYDKDARMLKIDPRLNFTWDELITVSLSTLVVDVFGNELVEDPFSFKIASEPTAEPTGIVVTLTDYPDTATESQIIRVSGTLNFDNGLPVPSATVLACHSSVADACDTPNTGNGNAWSLEYDNGSFSGNMPAPIDDAYIYVYADYDNETFTDYESFFIDITEPDYTTPSYDLTTAIVHQVTEENNSLSWQGKESYKTTDQSVFALVALTNYNSATPISLMYRYYSPDDSLYGEIVIDDAFPADTNSWYYQYHGYDIAGYPMASNPGQYKVKIYLDEGDGWNKVATEYFTIGWDLIQHRISKGFDHVNHQPFDFSNSFTTDNEKAYVSVMFENLAQPVDVKWEFIEPNGDVYFTTEHQSDDPADEGYDWYGWWTLTGSIDINGVLAEQKPGLWNAKVYLRNPVSNEYEISYQDSFELIEATPVDPTASLSLNPTSPIERDAISLNYTIEDDKMLSYFKIFYDIGNGWQTLEENEIFSTMRSSSISLGTAQNSQEIKYYAEVSDTSGNVIVTSIQSISVLSDNDTDGIPNLHDNCPFVFNPDQINTDGIADGGDACDADDDNDGVLDVDDAYPLISVGSLTDTDSDGAPNDCDSVCLSTGMTADLDDDNDGVLDEEDAFPTDPSEWSDGDGDGIGDNSDVGTFMVDLDGLATQVNETECIPVPIYRFAGSSGDAQVDASLLDGSAVFNVDFTGASEATTTLSYADGQVYQYINICGILDSIYEGSESLTISLSNPTNGSDIQGDDIEFVINDMTAGFEFESANYSVDEDGTSVLLTVKRLNSPWNTVSIDYFTSDSSATASEDYNSTSGTLQFEVADEVKSFEIPILDDTNYEGNEVFNVRLNNPSEYADTANIVQANVEINENDPTPPAGVLSLLSGTYSFNESAGSISILVSRTGGEFGEISVDYSTGDNSATASLDYASTSGTLIFANGELSKIFNVELLDDTSYEGEESFNILLSNFIGTQAGEFNQAVVTILEDDPVPPSGELNFAPIDYSVSENAGSVPLTIERTNGNYGAVSATLQTQGDSATGGIDYIESTINVNFDDGELSKIISINLQDDTGYEGNEVFSATLSNPQNGVSIGSSNVATITITEDDPVPPAGSLSWSGEQYSASENSGYIVLTVNRINGTFGEVSVDVNSTDVSATTLLDYAGVNTTLTFADGENSKTLYIELVDDSDYEGDETFNVSLSNSTGNAQIISPSVATVTILEDDPTPPAGNFQWSSEQYSVAEDAGELIITINRINGSYGAVSVDVHSADGTAFENDDYSYIASTLNFADGEISKTVTVGIVDDNIYEGNESFSVSLSNPTGGSQVVSPSTTAVVIEENEPVPEPGELNWDFGEITIFEDMGDFYLPVIRTNGHSGDCYVTASITHETTSSNDFSGVTSQEIHFTDGMHNTSAIFSIVDDSVEEIESFEVVLSNAINCTLGGNVVGRVNITDNDTNTAPVANAGLSQTVDEGVAVSLSGEAYDANDDELTVEWTQISGTTVSLTDASTLTPAFVAPEVNTNTTLVFRLKVSDYSKYHEDDVSVVVRDMSSGGGSDSGDDDSGGSSSSGGGSLPWYNLLFILFLLRFRLFKLYGAGKK